MSNKVTIIGWREWLSLPELGIPTIRAKIDTGARTSALHAFKIEAFEKNGEAWVRFYLHPYKRRREYVVMCESAIVEQRHVTDSGGHREQRYVIATQLNMGDHLLNVELSLTNRASMRYLMLLGRTALRDAHLVVDSAHSYLLGKPLSERRLGD
ncbi:MAG: ATP-dependent zinc protease [Thiotrichaceae bacterium]|nr:ATP-dependent zinc protease [Thiotrichaceae bacterium]